ncbi:MAG: nitroreductase family protein [Erysipelotrichaceae bacterium]|nr:nitroreductase family protein [Erysipelotrichaceae bacterium]
MTLIEALKERHSVRQYSPIGLKRDDVEKIQALIKEVNEESGLAIRFVRDDEKAFENFLAKYGKFKNVSNYLALVGPKSDDLEEKCGYYGEKIVLEAQRMGLRTCFVGGTYRKNKKVLYLKKEEELVCVIAIGYGENDGYAHKYRKIREISNLTEESPEWFRKGVGGAMMAPTALNQQKYYLECTGEKVKAKAGRGPFTKVDLGIVKYNFEVTSGKDHSVWEN